MTPPSLAQRYDRLVELHTAKDLLASIEESGLVVENEKQFLSEKIRDMRNLLDDAAADAQRIIDQMDDAQAQIYASLHYQDGFSWGEIAVIFHISVGSIKTRVYRSFAKILT